MATKRRQKLFSASEVRCLLENDSDVDEADDETREEDLSSDDGEEDVEASNGENASDDEDDRSDGLDDSDENQDDKSYNPDESNKQDSSSGDQEDSSNEDQESRTRDRESSNEDQESSSDEDETGYMMSKDGQEQWHKGPVHERWGRQPARNVMHNLPGPTRFARHNIDDTMSSTFELFINRRIQAFIVKWTNKEGRSVFGADRWRQSMKQN